LGVLGAASGGVISYDYCTQRGTKLVSKVIWPVVVQFDCHPRASAFCEAKDLGAPRELSRFSRQNNRAIGSHP